MIKPGIASFNFVVGVPLSATKKTLWSIEGAFWSFFGVVDAIYVI